MKNLNMTVKMVVSFFIVIVLSVAIALAGIWGMNEIKIAADDLYHYNVNAMDALGSIRENFALQRRATRDLALFGAGTAFYEKAQQELKDLENAMDELVLLYTPTMNTEADRELFKRFEEAYYNEYMRYKEEFLSYTHQNQIDAVRGLIETQANSIVSTITDILHQSHAMNIKAAKEALGLNESLSKTMRGTEIAALSITILVVILLVSYLTRLISTPLKVTAKALRHMGTTGNMTLDSTTMKQIEEDMHRKDEIGMTAGAIINLLQHIWNIDHTIQQISNGNFDVTVKTLSPQDTIGLSVAKVKDNLNSMFSKTREAEEQAKAASNAKGQFLAHMSHEIRTPLNAIMGMTAIVSKAAGDKEKTLDSIAKVMSSSQHLLSIVNDVLDMAKIESGKFDLVSEPFSLEAAVFDVISIVKHRCDEKQIHFITNTEGLGDYVLMGDKTRINQVLINLLGNAVKFTGDGGEVRLMIERLEETKKTLRLQYTVSDTGIGMSEEQLSRLFQPFEQGSNATAARYGGTGLGLSISHNLVNMMGGTLEVKSETDKGSTFFFELCLDKGTPITDNGDDVPTETNFGGHRILLAEDVAINRVIVKELLSDTGLLIDEAEDGQKAAEMFEHSAVGYYSLVFMDVQMPIMDGYEATRTIRSLDRDDAKTVPIVAMTANVYKEDVDRSAAAGMNRHLSKPIAYEALLGTLREYLS